MEKCQHYNRGCKFIAPCCNNIVNCRICHDDEYDHKIDRFKIESIICNQCGLQQAVSNKCIQCNLVFAEYFCKICRLYDTHETNKYFHCNDCGLCRVGTPEEVFHCDKCNICLSITLKDNHNCRKELFRNDCCICLEDLFTSREGALVLPCYHTIHIECRNKWIKNKIGCPLCRKTMINGESLEQYNTFLDKLISDNPIDEIYLVDIKCNDCGKTSNINNNPYGRKCTHCGSYNTIM